MSSEEVRKVSRQDIQLVQNLIERCLQLYMNQKEVVDTLLYQAKIEPGFTELGNLSKKGIPKVPDGDMTSARSRRRYQHVYQRQRRRAAAIWF